MILEQWNWSSWKAAGRHVLTYSVGIVTGATAIGLLSQADGSNIITNINLISDGIGQVGKGIGGLLVVLTPIYTAWRSAHSATPKEQIKSVVSNLSAPELTQAANAVQDPEGRNKLIDAVGEMPEVRKIIATPVVASNTNSNKVVAEIPAKG